MAVWMLLGPSYGRNITQARQELGAQRKSGAITVSLVAPITSPIIEVAIDGTSLYVLGFRRRGASAWWEFEPDGNQPHLTPATRIVGGPATYSNLGLAAGTDVVITPWQLLLELGNFDGLMGDAAKRRKLLLLIFLVSEALRFDSVKAACYAYVSNAGTYFAAPDHYYRHPEDLAGHRFVFTPQLVDTVRNWSSGTLVGHHDIGMPWVR